MNVLACECQSAEALVGAYEALRQQATEQGSSSHRELGLALLMRQGVAAWLQAYRQAIPKSAPQSDAAMALPPGIRGDLTLILAGMALGVAVKETYA